MSSKKLPLWSEIKTGLQYLDENELIKIIRDLYQLSKENKIFLSVEAIAELLVYYVEQGVACTLEHGDIHEQLYRSLESAFVDAVTLIRESGAEELIEKFRPRLRNTVSDTVNIGWGFHDYLEEVFYNEYPDEQDE